MQIHAHYLGYKTKGEHNDTDIFISGHFCTYQDKVVYNSVVFLTDFCENKAMKKQKVKF